MFLAHFSQTSITDLLEWPLSKLQFWHSEAVQLHHELNEAGNHAE